MAKIQDAGKAILSGWIAANVLGVTSANMRITNVNPPVAMATPASPQIRTAMMVAMAEDNMLTKLLPIKMTPISLSGRSKSELTFIAERCLLLARCLSRYLFSDNMPVSELEKKAESNIRQKSVPPRTLKGISFKKKSPQLNKMNELLVLNIVVSNFFGGYGHLIL